MNGVSVRILAIEPRHSRFGYALFEGARRLLDWGASSISAELVARSALAVSRKRVAAVIQRSYPAAIVMKRPRSTKTGKTSTVSPIFKAILLEAAAQGIPVYLLSREELVREFSNHQGANDEHVAEALVNLFPELSPRLPAKRHRKWQPERRAMVVFGAVAAGLAYCRRMKQPP